MIRRLLACLVLLTGLAAAGAPAQAMFGELAGAQVELNDAGDRDSAEQPSPCREQQRKQRARGEQIRPCEESRTIRIYVPTVQLGPDRALE
ncbi:MAG: hypothetical protein ACR2FJ_08130 [Qipengyuania sp.]